MQREAVMVRALAIGEAKDRLDDLVEEMRGRGVRVMLETADGTALAGVVSTKDVRRLAWMDAQEREALDVLEAMQAPFRGVPTEEIERETEKALAEIRVERRAERERAKAKGSER